MPNVINVTEEGHVELVLEPEASVELVVDQTAGTELIVEPVETQPLIIIHEQGPQGPVGTIEGGLAVYTSDTDDLFKIIAFSNTTVKAIPYSIAEPGPPTGLSKVVRLTSVTLSWTAPVPVLGGTKYDVYRNGTKIAQTAPNALNYQDRGVVVGQTYVYHVISVDPYGQVSVPSSTTTAFIDPSLNVAPVVEVTTWPATLPAVGKGLIRVCGSDVDAQTLSFALSVDTGLIEPTDDPSIWLFSAGGA